MPNANRSIYIVMPLAPDGGPSQTVMPFNAVITPYVPTEPPVLPPTEPPIEVPPPGMPDPSLNWKFLDDGSGWNLCWGPLPRPRPTPPGVPDGGQWKQLGDGWYYCYATGDKPRPPGPIEPPGVIPPDPEPPGPDDPVDTMLKEPPPGGWGVYNDKEEGTYNVYRPSPEEPQPKGKKR
jgi:hypothetical protein